MDQISNYGDDRQTAFCAHCAGATETRDHVPSRVLLDEPYPENLPVVFACEACNRSFSPDEEYVACLVDCVIAGSAAPDAPHRLKVRRILSEKPALAARFENARFGTGAATRFDVEIERVRNVVMKLARGHALYELNSPEHGTPSSVLIIPIQDMDADARERFENPPALSLWPEAGSRSMQRLSDANAHEWVTVQANRYRYLAYVAHGASVRIVLSEYLACEVTWADPWQAPRPNTGRQQGFAR